MLVTPAGCDASGFKPVKTHLFGGYCQHGSDDGAGGTYTRLFQYSRDMGFWPSKTPLLRRDETEADELRTLRRRGVCRPVAMSAMFQVSLSLSLGIARGGGRQRERLRMEYALVSRP